MAEIPYFKRGAHPNCRLADSSSELAAMGSGGDFFVLECIEAAVSLTAPMWRFLSGVLGLMLGNAAVWAADTRPARAEHIVVVVWDGMRPDFVSPQFTPHLHQLASEGVFFRNHHPVYVSSTEVNGTALATED